ncbi:hydroxyethylthiazole kinase, partial [Pantoea agglomerans]|nr:hydroxyethylthiazole kinase [Pantoea agglomerans]
MLHAFRRQSPLVHCMTNDVVQNFTANVLLALHA